MKRWSRYPALLVISSAAWSVFGQEAEYDAFFVEVAVDHVPNYRLPRDADFGPSWSLYPDIGRDGAGDRKAPYWTSGDFNADDTLDYAYLLIDEATRDKALFAFVSVDDGYRAIRLDETAWEMWLSTAQPGRYLTAAAKGYGVRRPDDVLAFEVERHAIEYGLFESAASVFVWDADAEAFQRYWVSD